MTTATSKSELPFKAYMMRQLNAEIPQNDYGLPKFYYRSDILPASLSNLNTSNAVLPPPTPTPTPDSAAYDYVMHPDELEAPIDPAGHLDEMYKSKPRAKPRSDSDKRSQSPKAGNLLTSVEVGGGLPTLGSTVFDPLEQVPLEPELQNLSQHPELLPYLKIAAVALDYSQGFPTQPSGDAFWSSLPGESADCHRAFLLYLDLPRANNVSSVRLHNDPGDRFRAFEPGRAIRQLSTLCDMTGLQAPELLTMFHLYCWQARAQAYDLYISVAHNKRRQYLAQDLETEHLAVAEKYIQYAQTYLDKVFANPESFELKPAEAMRLLATMLQLQRTSLGIGAVGGKGAEKPLPQNAPIEVILRTLVQQAGMIKKDDQGTVQLTQQLLANPEDLAAAQELIIRTGDRMNPRISDAYIDAGPNDY